MNEIELKEYNHVYQTSVELLSNNVSFFDIFPKFFIYLNKNTEFYALLKEKDYSELSASYKFEVSKALDEYIQKLESMINNLKNISKLVNEAYCLEFLQFIMASYELIELTYNYNENDFDDNKFNLLIKDYND